MKAIDFRFRPNTPDAVDGLIHSPFFGDMCAFFNYPDRAWSASLDKIVEIMDEHEITGVITGRDVETTYGCPCSNMGVVEMMGDASPARVDEVARDFPDLTIVMSHGGYPYVQEACMVCHRNANVYMEWSEYETWPFADGYVKAGNELIPDKLIFASAHPFYDSWERAKLYETLGFRPDVLENVLYNNAARILGIA